MTDVCLPPSGQKMQLLMYFLIRRIILLPKSKCHYCAINWKKSEHFYFMYCDPGQSVFLFYIQESHSLPGSPSEVYLCSKWNREGNTNWAFHELSLLFVLVKQLFALTKSHALKDNQRSLEGTSHFWASCIECVRSSDLPVWDLWFQQATEAKNNYILYPVTPMALHLSKVVKLS